MIRIARLLRMTVSFPDSELKEYLTNNPFFLVIYYSYLKIGVEGLLALRSYKVEDQTWGGDHDGVCKIKNNQKRHDCTKV